MMRVLARGSCAGVRAIGSGRWVACTSSSHGRYWMSTTDSERKSPQATPKYRANVLLAVAAAVLVRPLWTTAATEQQQQQNKEDNCHGKTCLFPVDIVQPPPEDDKTHNQRHASSVLQELKEIRNSTRQELEEKQWTALSTTATTTAATVTMTGFKGGIPSTQINQDRALVVEGYTLDNKEEDNLPRTLLGVMDGHAARGEVVSEYVVTELPLLLAKRLKDALDPSSGVTDDVLSTTKRVLSEVFVELDQTAPADPTGGCTCSVILQQGDNVYIANAGDSVSLIGVYQKSTHSTQILYTSREDKPHLADERQRVEEAGGYVYVPPRGTSRVVYVNPQTGAQTGLAMSRSIGDWAFGKLGVVPDPIVDVVHLPTLLNQLVNNATVAQSECWTVDDDGVVTKVSGPECDEQGDEPPPTTTIAADDFAFFAISATDGMIDYIQKEGMAQVVAQSLFEAEGTHPVTACQMLVEAAAQGWYQHRQGRYRDDIAIAMAALPLPVKEEGEQKTASSSQKEEL